MKKSHVPVLIVGAGAAGTMLTLELARRGVHCRTIDRLPKPGDTSKAITVHARTLEMLERIDQRLADRFLERGIHNKGYVLHFVDAAGKRYVDEQYRFIFVGRTDATPKYYDAIRELLLRYRMPEGRFIFTGPVTDVDLAAYYRTARVYISLSEHEGFCVPLLEAMAADVPVLAYGATAVPDTLGGAGVQFAPKDLEFAAELLGELAYNDQLRTQVIAGQRRRLADFGDDRIRKELERLTS